MLQLKTASKSKAATPSLRAVVAAGCINFRGKAYTVTGFREAFPNYRLKYMKNNTVFVSAGGEK